MATWSELKFKLIATGDETGTWGETTNENLGTAIEQAITGSTDITFLDDNVTLVLADTTALQQARALRLNLIGGVTASKYLQVPDIQKYYIISNTLTENIVIQNSTGSDYTVPAGTTAQVFSTGTGIKNALSFFSGAILSPAAIIGGGTIDDTAIGLTTPNTGTFTTLESTSLETTTITGLTTPLSTAQGGTGTTSTTGTGSVVFSASPTLTGSPLAPTQTAGDNSTKIATTAYVATAVTNGLGTLGTMATQNANNVAITGGTASGMTSVAATTFTGNVTGNVSGNAGTVTNGVYTTDFTSSNQSLSTNGYQKLPGGLIMQWGNVSPAINTTTTVTFPTAFPNACVSVQLTILNSTTSDVYVMRVNQTPTTTDFVIRNSQGTSYFTYWLAIGY
jgi:hypothetical protein